MAKFYGEVGYHITSETSPGVWKESIVKRNYYGDIQRNYRRLENGDQTNDNLNVSNTISIVADAFAYSHFFAICYVEWMGTKWKVSGVEVSRPRLILTVGGVYNGPEDKSSGGV